MPERLPSPDRFDEAVKAFRRRVPMTDAQFDRLDAAAQSHAFKVAGVADARLVQETFDAIDRAVENGTTFKDFKVDVGAKLEEAWGGEDAPRLETVFRTNVMTAYNDGRDAIFDHPEVKKARPFRRFDAVGDSRDCPICEPLDGTILPADDPFWERHKLPLHPNCRCESVALSPEEADDEGVDDEAPEAEPPAEGFGTREEFEPDYSSFSPEVAGVLRDKLDE